VAATWTVETEVTLVTQNDGGDAHSRGLAVRTDDGKTESVVVLFGILRVGHGRIWKDS